MKGEVRISKGELSCLIGNLFSTVKPPCDTRHVGEIVITGTTHNGRKATLVITGDAFFFDGDIGDLIKATVNICPYKNECLLFKDNKGGIDGS